MPLPKPTAIVFDTFGTVVDWRGSLIVAIADFGNRRQLTADWAAFVDRWRAAYSPSMNRVRNGEIPWTNLDGLHRASLDQLVEEFALGGLTGADRHSLCRLWHSLSPWPDAIPGLCRLKRQFIIGPLSNGNVSLLTNMAKHAGLPWDVIFGSDLFRHYKPDPETYLGVCRLLDLEPRQVMMAAAHNSDLAAARSLGLMTAFFPRSMEYGPNQVRDFIPEAEWDVVADNIEDMATRLGA